MPLRVPVTDEIGNQAINRRVRHFCIPVLQCILHAGIVEELRKVFNLVGVLQAVEVVQHQA